MWKNARNDCSSTGYGGGNVPHVVVPWKEKHTLLEVICSPHFDVDHVMPVSHIEAPLSGLDDEKEQPLQVRKEAPGLIRHAVSDPLKSSDGLDDHGATPCLAFSRFSPLGREVKLSCFLVTLRDFGNDLE